MKRFLQIVAVFIIVVVILQVVILLLWQLFVHPRVAPTVTQALLQNITAACNQYITFYGEPPASLSDLTRNRSNIVFIIWPKTGTNDGWGNPIHLTPYDASLGHGRIISYGRDGRPGGSGIDADVEVSFGEIKK